MAMTKCKECKGNVSTKADKCPHCGVKNPGRNTTILFKIFAFIVAAGALGGMIANHGATSISNSHLPKPEKIAQHIDEEQVTAKKTFGIANEKADKLNILILKAPFQHPYQYVGMTISSAAKATAGTPNSVGNIIIDTDDAHMLLEAEGNYIDYVEVELKKTAPCSQARTFDSEPILRALSIKPSELELTRKQKSVYSYSDHKRKLKVGISCDYNGGPLTVGFSSKYYGM